jgi:hypothetical protein
MFHGTLGINEKLTFKLFPIISTISTIMNPTDKQKFLALTDIIGKTFENAQKIFQTKYPQFTIQCAYQNGQPCAIDKTINWNRLTIGIENDVVVDKYNIITDVNGNRNCCAAYWG